MSNVAPDITPHSPFDKSAFSAQLRPVLEALARAREMTLEDVADAAWIPRSTFYDRLKKGNFSAFDFANIARALNVSVDTLYLSVDELLAALRTGSFATWLEALPEPTGQLSLDDLLVERPFLTAV